MTLYIYIYKLYIILSFLKTCPPQSLGSKGFYVETADLVVWSGDASSENTSSVLPKLNTTFSLLMQTRSIAEEKAHGEALSRVERTLSYFLSVPLQCVRLGNVGQCGWLGFQISGQFFTMTKRCVQVQWRKASYEPSWLQRRVLRSECFSANHTYTMNFIMIMVTCLIQPGSPQGVELLVNWLVFLVNWLVFLVNVDQVK